MASTILNTDVEQKDAHSAVVVAVTSRDVFKDEENEVHDVLHVNESFQLLQILPKLNKLLKERNPEEYLLFDVILITTDSQQQQQSSRIISSTKHHGLEISRFCFASEEDFIESLQKNNVQLFLTTDRNEASQATQKGVLSALLDQQIALSPSDQLRILFCEDAATQPDTESVTASKQAVQGLAAQLGEMRRRFSMSDSPLCFILVTSHSGRESCANSLLTLRSSGLSVDEVYCLAGAPQGPIMSVLQPHFTLSVSFSLEE
ncbi:cytosolic 5'-nucleotidase 1B [Cheilinus undulatus]|uniref:cytosolic 5'-nucleotidase 1B n=1 Tax=Cheilinus undulatus TaxID=241271 RepID=UPI001BD4D053|nr:cytosolic 5'-nucleotidase 1B [Cheilinus undulatus]XP_041651778.1 cytosolic 5'-nucleotidase 1B [Cheilinus undulatus]